MKHARLKLAIVAALMPAGTPGLTIAHADPTFSYLVTDALGTPIVATAGDGSIVWREHHRPFGEKLLNDSGNGEPTGFAGHRHDSDTGLIYMGARYYDPTLGRFMGMDPLGVSASNLAQFNAYAYANNDPYGYVNPDGRQAVDSRYGTVGNPGEARSLPPGTSVLAGGVTGKILRFLAPSSLGEAAFDAGTNVIGEIKVPVLATIFAVRILSKLGDDLADELVTVYRGFNPNVHPMDEVREAVSPGKIRRGKNVTEHRNEADLAAHPGGIVVEARVKSSQLRRARDGNLKATEDLYGDLSAARKPE